MRNIYLLLFLLSCQPAIGLSQTVIQMKKEGGVSVIPCKVNGLSLSFIFDTGASDVSISMTEALFMLKNDYLSKDDILGTNKYGDATGAISEGIVINLKEIDIAGIKLQNVAATIVKNADAPLLLGQSAISKLGNVQLDLAANTLTITNKEKTYSNTSVTRTNSQQRASVIKNTLQPKPLNSKSSSMIENPIKMGGLIIAQNDFPDSMTWSEAKKACFSLGEGWRLPTKRELNEIYRHKDEIGGFTLASYWSSSEDDSWVWGQHFNDGLQYIDVRGHYAHIRAVRGNSNSLVIGNPIKLGRLFIAQQDFEEKLTLDEAKSACTALGHGWRLPTKEELNEMYKHMEEIGGFLYDKYWSSSVLDKLNYDDKCNQDFRTGYRDCYGRASDNTIYYVRAVRTYK